MIPLREDGRFVLDTNIFVQPYKTFYSFDLVPTFWKTLIQLAEQGKIVSVDKVYLELQKGNDELAKWSKTKFEKYFLPTDEDAIRSELRQIMKYVKDNERYSNDAKCSFAKGADGYLIAFAKANNCNVVTFERLAGANTNKIKIPNLCRELQVPCCNLFEMLRVLCVRL